MRYILRISAHDALGLVYKVSRVLYEAGLNIEKNDEFVDNEHDLFYMRTQITGTLDIGEVESKLRAELAPDTKLELKQAKPKSLVILATKENHCLGDLLLRYENGELNAHIQAVIANHNDLRDLAGRFGIPFFCIESSGMSREEHERALKARLDAFAPDFIALAKYMRILSSEFVAHYPERMINIHHGFLPAFIGANPYKQAFDRGVKIIGATAHFVTKDLDEGPIITQDIIKIDHNYTWQDMQRAGRDIEKSVFAHALDLVLNDRVFVNGNKTIVF
ncbi:formyltetrahydrofolate deformylase [Helicobacter sp. CLO-3]|uniref:formyltetrahydrofolate deformylase n=1 Tax=unclassified Helicobacter TaxID=2593540 RepID=UPI000805118A|nr:MULTISPECIES: formyltetrahydrofolate deformylase [unclassified Helicobacter]OBV28922.1 formyltetrahydrofolate deformylase [Helicobacter sp. CLO-3]OHU83923.1 formyltetrahydrofolate deformylase [Helicobacter sp. CLO-3]